METPEKRLYAEFGGILARRAARAGAWLPIVRGISCSLVAIISLNAAAPDANPHGGRLGLPADFLIDNEGRVLACEGNRTRFVLMELPTEAGALLRRLRLCAE